MADDDKELKDQRVVTMMSPSELEAIDDWMFKNRIRSRGEAIRRLCQVGMKTDQYFDDLTSAVTKVSAEGIRALELLLRAAAPNSGLPDGLRGRCKDIEIRLEAALSELEAQNKRLLVEIVGGRLPGAFDIILGEMEEVRARLKKERDDQRDRREDASVVNKQRKIDI